MTTLYSTGLKNHLAVTGSLLSALNNCLLDIYSGPVPASADDAVDGSSVKLCTISVGGAGTACTFETTATNGVLTKKASEAWSGSVAATGTASFWRLYVPADTGATADASATYSRVQGTCGTDVTAEMVLPSVDLTSGNTQAINLFQVS